jgi:hypothetical protein
MPTPSEKVGVAILIIDFQGNIFMSSDGRDGTGTGYQPVRYRSGFQTGRSTGRPAGPVRSNRLRPVPVAVVKNPDRFHLCRMSFKIF